MYKKKSKKQHKKLEKTAGIVGKVLNKYFKFKSYVKLLHSKKNLM